MRAFYKVTSNETFFNPAHIPILLQVLKKGVTMDIEDIKKQSLILHEENKGKIEVVSKVGLNSRDDLNLAYTPGVAEPCLRIADDPDDVYRYTSKGNLVAVLTDGSAVLGLGKIGPKASLPVMEGKSILFKEFGGVDAFPIAVDSHDPEKIIETAKMIAPGFGGINLEDIKGPECFEIEERLKKELDIPVFHDDQHGTAVVALAGLINAAKITKKDITKCKVVINGAGAAGVAIAKIFLSRGVKDMVMLDSKGALYTCRDDIQINKIKKEIAQATNIECRHKHGEEKDPEECARCMKGKLEHAIVGRDVFIGVSKPGLLTKDMVRSMAKDPIIFAMANPIPEIMYDDAIDAGAAVMGTGRSDMPNQVNNVLAFPGIFRGALDVRASDINDEMKLAAALAIAESVKELSRENIIPDPFDRSVHKAVADAVRTAAIKSGVARDGSREA